MVDVMYMMWDVFVSNDTFAVAVNLLLKLYLFGQRLLRYESPMGWCWLLDIEMQMCMNRGRGRKLRT